MIDIKAIRNAAENIRLFVHRTPLIYSSSFSRMTGAEVYLKAENLQKTGSFKVRGAFNRMVSLRDGKVIAASMGNHAQGVAYAAGRLGLHAKIVMPVTAPIVKEEATRGYGAEVVLHGESFREALEYALIQKDYLFIHAFDDDAVIAGQGTVGLEITEDMKDVDVVLVPVGGGGLISGVSTAVKAVSPKTEVIGIQTEAAPSAYVSFREKRITEKAPLPTLADGIAVGEVGGKALELMNRYVDDISLVTEDSIAMAILLFLERKKLVVEGAGTVPLAALLENRGRFRGKRVVLVVSGGNIDFTLIDKIIHKGLVSSGRIGVFEVTVDDVPGSLHSLTGVIASARGNILNVIHDRLSGDLPVGKTRVIFTIETRGEGHYEEIISRLVAKGFEIRARAKG
ncbi:MAG: threonine ammonia-lyase [Nitrospirae bacterium]|nr:threonine ammonia-lyase [Nitrospirota bacterium]MCL5422812.1 threonine ammonia-lyase [Nitrospirota bacterium]